MSEFVTPSEAGFVGLSNQRFKEIYPRLRRYACMIRPPEIDPDDLLQDALAKVLVANNPEEISHPEAYIARSMLTIASDRRRRFAIHRRALTKLGLIEQAVTDTYPCLLYTSPSPRDKRQSRMPSSA